MKKKPAIEQEKEGHDPALTPITDLPIFTHSPKMNSAGVPAIISAVKMAGKYMKASDAVRTMFKLNQKGGIDCPGCAWPDPDDDRSAMGEYCENGVKAISEEAQSKTLDPSFFESNSIDQLGRLSDLELGKTGRIAQPLVLNPGDQHYSPINWNAAFDLIGKALISLRSPDEAIFYTSGRTSNEAAFMYQLFVRAFGTNNLPDCSNMCHESSGFGLHETIGIAKGSVTLDDIHQAELILVVGQNPGTNHPRMLSALETCKKNGGKIIAINPLPEAGLIRFTNPQKVSSMLTNGTKLADLHLPVRINGDVPLFKAILKLLVEYEKKAPGEIFDLEFIKTKTLGLDALLYDLNNYDLDDLVTACGVDYSLIEAAAEVISRSRRIIICWAMGVTQHENGVDNIREMVNLLLLKGSIGKAGAGVCPVRGHSNVQGDRTMGIWEEPPAEFLDRVQDIFGFTPPRHHGHSVTDAIQAMHNGDARVFIAMGGNFLSASPDTRVTATALRNCDLTVHVSTKLNRSHLVHGKTALILPCLGRTETDIQATGTQFVTVENSMGIVHSSTGVLTPCSGQLLSEPAIIAGMAAATLGEHFPVKWREWISNYDIIRDHISKTIPGFEDFNEKVKKPGGFYLPNKVRQGEFPTPNGKANFSINRFQEWKLPEGRYLMMTIRSHDQFNTTIYGLVDRYRGLSGDRWIALMNEDDMLDENLIAGDHVMIRSHYKGVVREAGPFRIIPYPIPRSCVGTYFPEANVLVPLESRAHTSKTPTSKSVEISLDKVQGSQVVGTIPVCSPK